MKEWCKDGKLIVQKTDNRIYSLDCIKVIAVLAVVMIHSCGDFWLLYSPNTTEFVISNFFESLSRLAVPLFLMASGALLLNEEKTITVKRIYSKYILNIFILLVFWSIFYAVLFDVIYPLIQGNHISSSDVIFDKILFGHYHLWYLYMMIGIYAVTPILKSFVKKENANIVLYFIILSAVIQFTSPVLSFFSGNFKAISYVTRLRDMLHIKMFLGFVTYYLVGWYLVHVGLSRKKRCILYGAGLLSAVLIFLMLQLYVAYGTWYSNMNIFILLYAAAVFAFIHQRFNNTEKRSVIVEKMSMLSFGVYVLHAAVLRIILNLIPYKNLIFFYILLIWALAAVVSFGLVWLMSNIPYVKKLVRA